MAVTVTGSAIVFNDGTTQVTAGSIPAGIVAQFAMTTPPSGWLKANGAEVSRTTYADLFAAIGTTFGAGNGSTTFRVPDLRGEFIRGWDDARGIDGSRIFGSFQGSQMQSHTHTGPTYGYGNGTTRWGTGGGNFQAYATTNATGGTSNGSENRPRNLALLFCIKF